MVDSSIAPWAEPDNWACPSVRYPQAAARAPLRQQAPVGIAPWDAERSKPSSNLQLSSHITPWDPPATITFQPHFRDPIKPEAPLDIALEPAKCLGCLYGPCPRRADQSLTSYLAMLCVGLAGCQCLPCLAPGTRF